MIERRLLYLELMQHQKDAIEKMHNGCILCGGVGTGKSLTSLAYVQQKVWHSNPARLYSTPCDLYIITTARKRDTLEWEGECAKLGISCHDHRDDLEHDINHGILVTIDSWNNIGKYAKITNAMFIFDEQRVVGYGAWSKAFFKITKANQWILLTATPGDTWSDYMSVFIANGYFKNKTDFVHKHVVYNPHYDFPKIDHYVNCGSLIKMRKDILVMMTYEKKTIPVIKHEIVDYDKTRYQMISNPKEDRITHAKACMNPYTNEPIKNASEYCYTLRRIVNSDCSRVEKVKAILAEHPRAIIFYNYDYELEILRRMCKDIHMAFGEYNGHKHDPLPTYENEWAYLVQYTAGCEGWNCVQTDTIIFYSLSYSYKVMTQAAGRIDRLNTPYIYLNYYYIKSRSPIDLAVQKALDNKENFNESLYFDK